MTRKFVSWICIFSILLLPQFVSADALLCIGEDGHVAIEKSVNGDCADSHLDLEKHSEDENNEEDSHCGDCTDIPLVHSTAISKTTSKITSLEKINPLAVASIVWTAIISKIDYSTPSPIPILKHPVPDNLVHLRTVVLLV